MAYRREGILLQQVVDRDRALVSTSGLDWPIEFLVERELHEPPVAAEGAALIALAGSRPSAHGAEALGFPQQRSRRAERGEADRRRNGEWTCAS